MLHLNKTKKAGWFIAQLFFGFKDVGTIEITLKWQTFNKNEFQ